MKSVIKVFLSLLVIVYVNCVYGQSYDSIKFREYKTPDLRRTTLSIPFFASFQKSRNIQDESNHSRFLDSDFRLSHFDISRKAINEIFVSTSFDYSNGKSEIFTPYYRNEYLINITAELSSQRFIKPNVFYEPVSNIFFTNRDQTYRQNQGDTEVNSDIIISQLRGGLFIGFGRRENVSTLWNAVVFLDILKSQNLLMSEVSVEQAILLADHIAKIQTIRNPDFRLESIEETKELYNFMFENNIIKESPISIAVLLDAYRYERFLTRFNGYEIKIAPILDWNYFEFKSNSTSNSITSKFGVGGEVQLNFYNPINQYFQLNFINIFSYLKTESLRSDQNRQEDNLFIQTGLELSYLYSQRTNFRLINGLSYRAEDLIRDDDLFLSGERNNLNFYTFFDLDYYFSPRLRFNVGIDYNYGDVVNTFLNYDNSSFSTRATIGISYIPL